MKRLLFPILLLTSTVGWTQGSAAENKALVKAASELTEGPSVYQSPVFYALCGVAIILLVFILQLGKVLSGLARNYAAKNKPGYDNIFKALVVTFGASFIATSTQASDNSFSSNFMHNGLGHAALNYLVVVIAIELFVAIYFLLLIRSFVRKEMPEVSSPVFERTTSYFWDKFNKSVSIESEAAVMTDHDYDGIRELDNALPPWWKYGFYLTIVFAFAYLGYYHMSANAPLSAQEYENQMAEAEIQKAEYRLKAANLVDENSVVMLSDAGELSEGKALFTQHCAVCHGASGEGKVGPNLTDGFWLHGGDIKDVFKTVKFGVAGKGMKSWQQELNPQMMARVASYVKSINGTNPMGAKAPEGIPYNEGGTIPSDTTGVAVADTSAMATN